MEQDFWRPHVPVCCGPANQNSETPGIFFEISKRRARSKG